MGRGGRPLVNPCASNPGAGISGTNSRESARGTADYLFTHLAKGASAGWVGEGYDSWYPPHLDWSFGGLLAVENKNAFPKTYTPRKNFYTMAQITKFVRP